MLIKDYMLDRIVMHVLLSQSSSLLDSQFNFIFFHRSLQEDAETVIRQNKLYNII
jgi:hypothetical protein